MKRLASFSLAAVALATLLYFSLRYTKNDLINDLNSITTPEEEGKVFNKVRYKVKNGCGFFDEKDQPVDLGQDDWYEKTHTVKFYYDAEGIPHVLRDKRNVFILLRPD